MQLNFYVGMWLSFILTTFLAGAALVRAVLDQCQYDVTITAALDLDLTLDGCPIIAPKVFIISMVRSSPSRQLLLTDLVWTRSRYLVRECQHTWLNWRPPRAEYHHSRALPSLPPGLLSPRRLRMPDHHRRVRDKRRLQHYCPGVLSRV
jgi:hypothetical protein